MWTITWLAAINRCRTSRSRLGAVSKGAYLADPEQRLAFLALRCRCASSVTVIVPCLAIIVTAFPVQAAGVRHRDGALEHQQAGD